MRERRRGYVLVEAVVAMALFSVGMVSVQSAVRQANYTRALAKDRTNAHFLVNQLMGAVEIQSVLEPGVYEGTFPDHPRFAYTYEIIPKDVPKPPIPAGLSPAQRAEAENFELPVSQVGLLRTTVFWTRLGNQYSETVETVFPPDRLPQQQEDELRNLRRNERQDRSPFS